MNAAAFAPVPIMLILFNWLSKKKGAKWAFRLSLLVFAFAMLLFPLGLDRVQPADFPDHGRHHRRWDWQFLDRRFLHLFPTLSQPRSRPTDAKETGKDRAGMFFAVQGVINQFVGSLAGSVLALLLGWERGVLFIGPIVAVMCVVAFFLFKPYPLGQPQKKENPTA